MLELSSNLQLLTWPFALAMAWVLGEVFSRFTHLPRISIYAILGFAFGNSVSAFLANQNAEVLLIGANLAFGLMLFELGYRINIAWLRDNPWIALTGALESLLTFAVVVSLAKFAGQSSLSAWLLGALAMSTSPASVLRVINEERAAGQVTERVLHLTAINCVMAVCMFKIILGVGVYQSSGDWMSAGWHSIFVLLVSAGIGVTAGVIVPAWLRRMGRLSADGTIAFAFGVLLLVSLTHVLKLSPIVAALTFGLVARHRRVSLSRTQRNFGVLGDLLSVLLFFYVASTIAWEHAWAGALLGVTLVLARMAIKIAVSSATARASGITLRKGYLTGIALAPMSVFALLLLEQSRYMELQLVDRLDALAAMALLLEVAGPALTYLALRLARETQSERKD
ncbi:cation:proton antiporter [Pseudoduganella sp. OTU4001]|uniref:cation:proton antiporter n=1 Tax=Pseudoduganella sp. OTU4001 TaxID=3043854 RepID=UPI00313E19E8